jgi:DNA mismatch repair protein MutL
VRRIVILDDNLVNMIAAGEVIERPASVVKELLENSIDAGAGRIVVQVEQGGRDLIRVIDDGCGIESEDLPLAFESHATSKIRSSQDLLKISTMGFRGEALASIASVSRLRLTSRTPDSIQAGQIEIDCGVKQEVVPCSGSVGTTVEVRNLFYKLPARRKFLRSANTEMTHVVEQFTRIALAYPSLDLTLDHGSRNVYRLQSGQSLLERISLLFTPAVAEGLMEATRKEKQISLRALIGRPDAARTSSRYQYIFLNQRFIRDKFILHAIKEAYRGLTEPNRHPVVFLFLEIPPEQFDVNVHPTKTEVRFENSNLIHSQVLSALRDKLLSCDFQTPGRLPGSFSDFSVSENPLEDLLRKGRVNRIQNAMGDFFQAHASARAPQRKFEFSSSGRTSAGPDISDKRVEAVSERPVSWTDAGEPFSCLQIHDSYLVLATEEGFEVIDQHALHERILYEKIRASLEKGPLASQRLLMPIPIEITDAQMQALHRQVDLVEKLGIEWENFGPKTIAIQAFPVLLEKIDPAAYVQEMLDAFLDKELSVDAEKLLHEVLDRAACTAAIKAGRPLSPEEIRQLLADRQLAQVPGRCPHGRPTSISFTLKELEKQFKRTGF